MYLHKLTQTKPKPLNFQNTTRLQMPSVFFRAHNLGPSPILQIQHKAHMRFPKPTRPNNKHAPFPHSHARNVPNLTRHLRHLPPRLSLQHHHVAAAAHVHFPFLTIPTVHACSRTRGRIQELLLQRAPLPRGHVEDLRAPLEPPLHLRAVATHDAERAAAEHGLALVALARHLRQRDPHVARHVVRKRWLQRVLLLVVPACYVHRMILIRRAREKRPGPTRHVGPTPPLGRQKVVDKNRIRRFPRIRVPPAHNDKLVPDTRYLTEHG